MEIRLGENIRRFRKESGFTQEQLAEALGVTTGAVYKWESGKAKPELEMLVDIAEFFETSVDVLLDYGWNKGSMRSAVKKIRELYAARDFEAAIRYSEKALQKYPNSFEVVCHSAQCYFLMAAQDEKAAKRCIELLERARRLADQNPDENVSVNVLQEAIALCHIGLKQYDKSIELLEKLNHNGVQDTMIGLIHAKFCHRPEEALRYLSDGFDGSLNALSRVTIGYVSAYTQLGLYGKAFAIARWTFDAYKGIRDTSVVTTIDKLDAFMLTILADVSARMDDMDAAYTYLRQARDTAARFDAAPEYRAFVGKKFYHGSMRAMFYDDLGDTARDAIEKRLAEESCEKTKAIWEEIKDEKNRHP